jgi:hypothetical protein
MEMAYMAFNYEMMRPPMHVGPFKDMPTEQARAYFEWFVGQQSQRVNQLMQAYLLDTGEPSLDFSRNSLIPLWRWMSQYTKEREYRADERNNMNSKLPAWAYEAGIQNGELSPQSLALAVDGGFYLANCFEHALPGKISWKFWQDTEDHYYHRPVLVFGTRPLVPHELFVNQMWAIVDGDYRDDQIRKRYDTWVRKLA